MRPSKHPAFDEHRQNLRAAFVEWLLAQEPAEVLDLGAGAGALVADLLDAGVKASGIEPSSQALERAANDGIPVQQGNIDGPPGALPSAEWIVIRHVLHHVENPARVLLRAAAAAHVGILVAEPYATEGFPCSEWIQRLDALTRRLDRDSGMIHESDIPAVELISMLPNDWALEVRTFVPLTSLPPEEVEVLVDRSARGEPLSDSDLKERDLIMAAAKDGLVCPKGSVVLMATRPKDR